MGRLIFSGDEVDSWSDLFIYVPTFAEFRRKTVDGKRPVFLLIKGS